MRLLLLPLFVALAHSAALAQGAISATAPTDADVLNRELAKGKGQLAAVPTTGSSFLLPYWAHGNVVMTSGTVPQPWLKYDLGNDQLLWRRPAGDSLELDTSEITEFSLADTRNKTYLFRRYLTAKIENLALRTAFFEVRYDAGRAALLSRHSRTLLHGNNGPSLAGRTSDRWVETTSYFVKRTDNVVEPIRLNAKSIIVALGKEKAPALQAYATREQLNLSEEADVVKLLKYYETL